MANPPIIKHQIRANINAVFTLAGSKLFDSKTIPAVNAPVAAAATPQSDAPAGATYSSGGMLSEVTRPSQTAQPRRAHALPVPDLRYEAR